MRADIDRVLREAPKEPTELIQGLPAAGARALKTSVSVAKPLSIRSEEQIKKGHPVEMSNPAPSPNSPKWTIELLHGNLHLMDSCLRLYGHPGCSPWHQLLTVRFVPYNEVIF